jgi:hypothetical protein
MSPIMPACHAKQAAEQYIRMGERKVINVEKRF